MQPNGNVGLEELKKKPARQSEGALSGCRLTHYAFAEEAVSAGEACSNMRENGDRKTGSYSGENYMKRTQSSALGHSRPGPV